MNTTPPSPRLIASVRFAGLLGACHQRGGIRQNIILGSFQQFLYELSFPRRWESREWMVEGPRLATTMSLTGQLVASRNKFGMIDNTMRFLSAAVII